MKAFPSSPPVRRRALHLLGVTLALSLSAVCTTVWAEPGATAATLPTARAELNASPAGLAGGRASLEVDSRQPVPHGDDGSQWRMRYVRWSPSGPAGSVGLSMGVGAMQPAAPGPYTPAAERADATVSPEIGVRWRSGWQANRRVDVGAFQSYDTSAATPLDERKSYNARAELQFRENRSKMGFDIGSRAFGMQLSSTSKVMLRSRHGRPMVYYRSTW